MQFVQTDISEGALVKAIRGNLCDFFRFLTHWLPPGDGFENDKFVRWYTPLPHPWFNGLLCLAPPSPADTNFIQETIQYFDERQVATFTCWMDTSLTRSDWESFFSS